MPNVDQQMSNTHGPTLRRVLTSHLGWKNSHLMNQFWAPSCTMLQPQVLGLWLVITLGTTIHHPFGFSYCPQLKIRMLRHST